MPADFDEMQAGPFDPLFNELDGFRCPCPKYIEIDFDEPNTLPVQDGIYPHNGTEPLVGEAAWSSASVSYIVGDIVERSGLTYSCNTSHTSDAGNGPPNAWWSLLNNTRFQDWHIVDYRTVPPPPLPNPNPPPTPLVIMRDGDCYYDTYFAPPAFFGYYPKTYNGIGLFVTSTEYLVPTWNFKIFYTIDDIVWFDGSSAVGVFRCILNHASHDEDPPIIPSNATYWSPIYLWDELSSFVVGDWVYWEDGKVYECTADNSDQEPPNASYWTEVHAFASNGDKTWDRMRVDHLMQWCITDSITLIEFFDSAAVLDSIFLTSVGSRLQDESVVKNSTVHTKFLGQHDKTIFGINRLFSYYDTL